MMGKWVYVCLKMKEIVLPRNERGSDQVDKVVCNDNAMTMFVATTVWNSEST